MKRLIAYKGTARTIAYARLKNGVSPGFDFFQGLPMKDQVKLDRSFGRMGDQGTIHDDEKFDVLDPPFFQFKEFQIRMPCAWDPRERGVLVITHGFIKKRDRTRREEIERARRILQEDREREDQERAKL